MRITRDQIYAMKPGDILESDGPPLSYTHQIFERVVVISLYLVSNLLNRLRLKRTAKYVVNLRLSFVGWSMAYHSRKSRALLTPNESSSPTAGGGGGGAERKQ